MISLLSLSAIGAFVTAATAATSSVVLPAVVTCRAVLGTILGTLGNAIRLQFSLTTVSIILFQYDVTHINTSIFHSTPFDAHPSFDKNIVTNHQPTHAASDGCKTACDCCRYQPTK